jgi:hypothetical protein
MQIEVWQRRWSSMMGYTGVGRLFGVRPVVVVFLIVVCFLAIGLPNLSTHSRFHEVLVFVHIPKCAGTTSKLILQRGFCHRNRCVEALSLRGIQRSWYSVSNVYRGDDNFDSLSFAKLPVATRRRIRLLQGHVPLGSCLLLNSPCYETTVLRDPTARLVSEVHWLIKTQRDFANMSASEFLVQAWDNNILGTLSVLLDNHATRLLSGDSMQNIFYGANLTGFKKLSPLHLERAFKGLAAAYAVGTVEKLEEYFAVLSLRTGYVFPFINEYKNANEYSEELSPRAMIIVKHLNHYDDFLYQKSLAIGRADRTMLGGKKIADAIFKNRRAGTMMGNFYRHPLQRETYLD